VKAWRPLFDLTTLTGDGLLTPPQKLTGGCCCWATVKASTELLGRAAEPGASTKLLTLDISGAMCGNYSAGELPYFSMAVLLTLCISPALFVDCPSLVKSYSVVVICC
jgi:hypothetical protein